MVARRLLSQESLPSPGPSFGGRLSDGDARDRSPAVDALRRPLRFALVAHDAHKAGMLAWAREHASLLASVQLVATGTTGRLLQSQLGLQPELLLSGPLGGDVQIAGRIAEGKLDGLFFFWDAAAPHPHEADVRALIRLASLYGIPVALNRATAGLLMEGFRQQMSRQPLQGEWRGRHRGAVQVG